MIGSPVPPASVASAARSPCSSCPARAVIVLRLPGGVRAAGSRATW
jgi:hypothetical protein